MEFLRKSRGSLFNTFYLFVVIIYAANASHFVRMYGDVRMFGNWFIALLSVLFFLRNRIPISKKLLTPLIVFFAYAVITTINNGLINAIWINKWIMTIFISYGLCRVYGRSFFNAYENIVYYLCITALLLWVIHLTIPDIFVPFAKAIRFSHSYSRDWDTINIIFYTINDESHLNLATRLILRNAGFAWEPGAFSVFIAFAIACNALRTGLKFSGNKQLLVFTIALLSTQSTTGFMILGMMVIAWLLIGRHFVYAILLVPIMIWINTLSFMGDKIESQRVSLEEFSVQSIDSRYSYNVNRFIAFSLYFDEFMRHPIIGLGGYDDGTWLRKNGYDNIALASGFGQMIAMYGLIMTLLYFFLVYKTIKKLRVEFSQYGVLMIFPIIGMLISYTIWLFPLFIAFAFWGYYSEPTEHKRLDQSELNTINNVSF